MLINTAHITGYPIVVYDEARARCVIEQAKKMGIMDIEVMTVRGAVEFINKGMKHNKSILIDEAEVIINEALNNYFHADVVACTFSIPYEDIMKKEEDNGGQ
jgi:hypothetical protein